MSIFAALIYFIVCHGGPADHFATFAEEISAKGHQVHIYATGPALKQCQARNVKGLIPFSLENQAEEKVAAELAKSCVEADAVITDVGHPFDLPLQRALKEQAPETKRLSYYDNPESFVPGGYSSTAAQVMEASEEVLFANANLAQAPLYEAIGKEINLPFNQRIGLGYYPMAQGEKIAKRRTVEQRQIRAEFFLRNSLKDQGQKVLVYMGGNNEEYFSKAFPAFIQFLKSQKEDFIVVLQQHPGAKAKNLDALQVNEWKKNFSNEVTPSVIISDLGFEEAQVLADAMLYYQTSAAPQFVLAGIPTIQVGHAVFEDLLVKNGLCDIATDAAGLSKAFSRLSQKKKNECTETAIRQGLGIRSDWATKLESALIE